MQLKFGRLDPLLKKRVPKFKGYWFAIGAGIIWASIGQGSGELIWWPYLTAKYNGYFLFLIIPASILGYWVNLEVIRYTTLTGENIFASFLRLNKFLGWILWLGMIATFLWFGGYVSAGGTALAELTNLPNGWDVRSKSLFWAYVLIIIYLIPLVFGTIIYKWIERIMKSIAAIAILSIIAACFNSTVFSSLNNFFINLIVPKFSFPDNWDPSDTSRFITAITFTGMGGYFTLMYSYWIRDKGIGMSNYVGRVTSPITGQKETIPCTGYFFENNSENRIEMKRWTKAIWIDNAIGVGINTFTLVLMCLLSFVILAPKGTIPSGWQIAVVQAEFFQTIWGRFGKVLFLIIAAAFLSDTWLGVTDAVSRMNADFITLNFKKTRKRGFRWWYYLTVILLTIVTSVTMLLKQPGALLIIGGITNFFAMAIYCPALIIMNYFMLPKKFPNWTKPGIFSMIGIVIATFSYIILAVWYLTAFV